MRRRIWRSLSWFGLVVSFVLMLLWLGSARLHVGHRGTPFYFRGEVADGALFLEWITRSPDGSRSGFGNPGWVASDAGRMGMTWMPAVDLKGMAHSVTIPLVIPLIAVAALALWLWRRSAAPPAGVCARCGYRLQGLAAGERCPECGHARLRSALWRLLGRAVGRGRPAPAAVRSA